MTTAIDYANATTNLLKVAIWPAITLFVLFRFGPLVSSVLERSSEFSVKVGGAEVRFSGTEAGPLLASVLAELDQATRDFGPSEKTLFQTVVQSGTGHRRPDQPGGVRFIFPAGRGDA